MWSTRRKSRQAKRIAAPPNCPSAANLPMRVAGHMSAQSRQRRRQRLIIYLRLADADLGEPHPLAQSKHARRHSTSALTFTRSLRGLARNTGAA